MSAVFSAIRSTLGQVSKDGWEWDPSLYSGSAAEAEIYQAAGFTDPTRVEVPGRVVVRHTDDIVASVFSLSRAAPHLFGSRRQGCEDELRELLHSASPRGRFSEQLRESVLDIWRVSSPRSR